MYFEYFEEFTKTWELTKLKFWQGLAVLFLKAVRPWEYEWIKLAKVKK